MDKPPLGVAPHWFVYNKRMQELAEAIFNNLQYINKYENTLKSKENYRLIAQWSEELKSLALLESELQN